MHKILTTGILILTLSQSITAQKLADKEQLCQEIAELLISNNKEEFMARFTPTKEDLLELAYGKTLNNISEEEKRGFFDSTDLTIKMLNEIISSSFNFLSNKITESGIQQVENITLVKTTDSKMGKSKIKNYYFIIHDGENEYRIEVAGLFRSERDWIITTAIDPWYY